MECAIYTRHNLECRERVRPGAHFPKPLLRRETVTSLKTTSEVNDRALDFTRSKERPERGDVRQPVYETPMMAHACIHGTSVVVAHGTVGDPTGTPPASRQDPPGLFRSVGFGCTTITACASSTLTALMALRGCTRLAHFAAFRSRARFSCQFSKQCYCQICAVVGFKLTIPRR